MKADTHNLQNNLNEKEKKVQKGRLRGREGRGWLEKRERGREGGKKGGGHKEKMKTKKKCREDQSSQKL